MPHTIQNIEQKKFKSRGKKKKSEVFLNDTDNSKYQTKRFTGREKKKKSEVFPIK